MRLAGAALRPAAGPLQLPAAERLILEAAALLHEVGYLINYEKHHQHSYHLIMHGNLRGLSPKQRSWWPMWPATIAAAGPSSSMRTSPGSWPSATR